VKERVINDILLAMSTILDDGQLEKLSITLHTKTHGVRMEAIENTGTELALSDASINARAYQMFFVTKKIEGLSEKSLRYYRGEIDGFFKVFQKSLSEVTADDVRYFLATRQGCSKVTLDNKRRVLNSFFSWLTSEDYLPKNPMSRLKVIKRERYLKKAFSEDEIEKLRDSCADKRDLAIVDLLLSTGMRCGELAILDRSSVDLLRGELTVFGKGSKERLCYLNSKAKKHLTDYLETRTDNDSALIIAQGNRDRHRLQISGIEKVIRDIGSRAGVTDVHPHRFRRTAATLAINRGMPIEQVQQMLGHEQIETTMRYAIVARENVKNSHGKYLS